MAALHILIGRRAMRRERVFRDRSNSMDYMTDMDTAGNRHKQNSWFCKEIREDNFRFWWRRVHEDASECHNFRHVSRGTIDFARVTLHIQE
jgi:GrpB-like predicted nucleotidyltransferase (UPF0157 family)